MLIFNQAVLIFVPLLFKYKNKKIEVEFFKVTKGSDKKSIKASV